ncbi:MAG: DegT/DnrJ/EryC1/StrS family aminotransferase [Acidobacteria bacterium]|nr:DegT/DnrJ/EryC1/StrS family aminotransferase [Acidobacteriota bacterium]
MSQLALFGGNPVRTKPFPSWPVFDAAEERAVLEVLRSGKWWRNSQGEDGAQDHDGEGPSQTAQFQRAFAQSHGARYGIACANGTAALEVAMKAAGVGPGDEVLVPPYTFIATATAPLAINAIPVFCDIESDTFNLDPERLEQAITPRTKAVVPVHFGGLPADMERINEIAARRGLVVIEDAAHAHGAQWNGRFAGTIGTAGTFSFQISKNMTAGEGGLILTDDEALAVRCESLVWGGRERGRPWYEHHRLGWNYRITEFQAAILLEQLKRLEEQNARRMANGIYLNQQLEALPGIHPMRIPAWTTRHSFHLYAFRFREEEAGIPRRDFAAALASEGIPCSTGYAHPLYRNPVFLNQEFYAGRCPVSCRREPPIDYAAFREHCPNTELACREAIWVEHRVLLGDRADMDDLVNAVRKVFEHRGEFSATPAR